MRPSAVHAINKITYNVTPSYEGVLWNKVFKECLEWKLRVTRLHANKIMLTKLKHKDQGTNEVENFVKRVKNHDTKSKIQKAILKHKISDAEKEEYKARRILNNKLSYINRRCEFKGILLKFIEFMNSKCSRE